MKKWFFPIIVFLSSVIQAGFPEFLKVFGVAADLLFICAVASGLFLDRRASFLFGLLCGILKDLMGVHLFGMHTLLLPIISLSLSELARRLSVDSGSLAAAVVFLASLIYSVLARVVLHYTGVIITLGIFLRIAFLQALYSALIFSLFFRSIKRMTAP